MQKFDDKILFAISEGILVGIDEYNELDEDWKNKAKSLALGLGLGAMTMGGMQSCKQGYNEPDMPRSEQIVKSNKFTPHEYQTGDTRGNSAKAFKEFYDNCDWDNCSNNEGYVCGIDSTGCTYNSRKYHLNIIKKDKKDGYYSYLMLLPRDYQTGKIKVGDKISDDYLDNNGQLQVIYTVNCLDNNGDVVQVDDENHINGNCKFSKEYKFFQAHKSELKDGQLWIMDKWIATDHTYHFQLLKIISVENEKYETIANETVDKDTYNIFEKGELWLSD